MHRVLIVERDPDAALALQITLGHAEFSATTVSSGDDVRAAIDRDKPHLVVLDWDLPGMITMNLLIHVRAAAKSRAPRLIALSEFSNEQRVVYALELGVDDYLVKPFSMRELVARVRALLRPLADSGRYAECVEFDRLRLDVGQARVTIRDQTVSLRTMEYRLLEFLVRHPERAFDRAQLLSRVWGHDRRAEMRAVDVTIQRIRKALTPHGCEGYLQTIRGTGYRISARAGTG